MENREEVSHALLDSLYKLRKRIAHAHPDAEDSMDVVDAYNYFTHQRGRGRNCAYSLKATALFFQFLYPDLKKCILEVVEYIRQIEGDEDFAR